MDIEKSSIDFFTQYLSEAPDETPPDVAAAQSTSSAPDVPPDTAPDTNDAGPPDIDDTAGDAPPDMGDAGGDDGGPPDLDSGFGDEGFGDEEGTDEAGEGSEEGSPDLGLDDKVSAIMNQQLYQRFLNLIGSISNQLTMIRLNNDMLYTLSKDTIDTEESIKNLDENIRLYLKNYFIHENYSKNLLFFNKCLNLLKLLNDSFDKSIAKGIKEL